MSVDGNDFDVTPDEIASHAPEVLVQKLVLASPDLVGYIQFPYMIISFLNFIYRSVAIQAEYVIVFSIGYLCIRWCINSRKKEKRLPPGSYRIDWSDKRYFGDED